MEIKYSLQDHIDEIDKMLKTEYELIAKKSESIRQAQNYFNESEHIKSLNELKLKFINNSNYILEMSKSEYDKLSSDGLLLLSGDGDD